MEYKLIMELLLQEQFKTYTRLVKLQQNFKENRSAVKGEIIARIELLSKYYKKFCENNETIENIFAKHKIDTNNVEYFKQDLAFKCELLHLSMMGDLLDSQSADPTIPAEPAAVPKEDKEDKENKEEKEETKPSEDLPKLEVRKYSGEITDWLEFRNEYCEMVHSNSDLSDSQKFTILISVLPKKVFELITNIFTSRHETGYEEAWTVLEEKFCKRTLVEAYLQKLMEQPSVALSKSIFRLLNKTIKYLNALQSLNVDTKNWDILITHILVQKLNDRTKTEWYASYSCHELPKLYDFFVFLNSKLPNNEELSDEIKKFKLDSDCVEFALGCACCNRKHPLWQCDKFECLSIDERLSFVKNKTICVRCLSSYHTLSDCNKPYTCRICQNKEHHYLLHKSAKRTQF